MSHERRNTDRPTAPEPSSLSPATRPTHKPRPERFTQRTGGLMTSEARHLHPPTVGSFSTPLRRCACCQRRHGSAERNTTVKIRLFTHSLEGNRRPFKISRFKLPLATIRCKILMLNSRAAKFIAQNLVIGSVIIVPSTCC
jgi:hypothetical protein